MNKYMIGDKVKLVNRNIKTSSQLYVIEGYEVKSRYIKGKNIEETVYTIKNLENGRILKLSPNFIIKPYSVDELLDKYNDLKFLYKLFNDESYKESMDDVLLDLKVIVNNRLYS